ncbi:hypothetical protein PMIN06_001898 [Paraphaeosphaeria minitans]|uniref:FAD binding domain-containing protein n=1 Tax=Paraphaeosphaeria minitans TaxID=565426 RepID=A0A9P6KRT6_9PLEO|nr:FAD binding domain-containing protein [Paraphaeosphaeria minitans]
MSQSLVSCCARLSAIDGLDVAFPNSSLYAATENAYWSIQEASLAPSCIAKPNSSEDVARIIATIANQDGCPFAIKSQGHAPAAGFANIDNGITIDLTALNAITTNKDASVAHIGTGASWLDVYAHLDTLNKTVAGGRNGGVGVGGLTLGGGISYFSPQAGFTCDTAINFEIVLVSGRLVNANATSRPDLFRALKGGLSNFGVVTSIDFRTLPVGEILGGRVVNSLSYRSEVFAAFAKIATAEPYDVHASITTSIIFNAVTKAWTLLSAPIYTKPQTDPEVYAELFAIPSVSNTVQLTQLHTLANETAVAQTNQLFSTGTYGPSAQLLDRIFDICNETLYDFNITGSLQWIATFEPLPTVFAAQGAHGNVLGTASAAGNGMILLLSASWSDAASSPLVHAKNEQVLHEINTAAEHFGLLRSLVYANYAGTFQTPVASYGAQSDAFLRRVARKYDPRAVFQTQLPGGFKLVD